MESIDEVIGSAQSDLEDMTAEDVSADDKEMGDLPVADSEDGDVLTHEGATISSNEEVIGLLLSQQSSSDVSDVPPAEGVAVSNLLTQTSDSITISTVQAVTLTDGTTAYIQGTHDKDGKFLEGQTVQLVDGSAAIVQAMPKPAEVEPQSAVPKFVDGQAVQLEDGTTAYIHHTHKEGLQAVQLEDGTTAYIAHNPPENLFGDGTSLDASTLNLDQLAGAQVTAEEHRSGQGGTITTAVLSTTPVKNDPVTVRISSDRALALGDKAFKCAFEGCGRLYTTQHHLKVHERSHTGDRPFKCEFADCGKAFATGYGLKSHTRVHTGEKPYRCPDESCDKSFKTSGDLQKHVRTHTGERPFKCPFEGCGRSFTTSNIRKVHIRTHTGERPYICEEEGCGRAFASATNYKNHIRIHTGEKPYVCTVQGCGKRFTEYSSLYKHHVVHTHSKPYVCNHCGKNYRQTSTLAMHKRTAHGEDTTPESEAQLFAQQQMAVAGEAGDAGPPEKRQRIQPLTAYQISQSAQATNGTIKDEEENNGTLVINTTDPSQVTMVTDSGMMVTDENGIVALQPTHQVAQLAIQQLQQQQGISLTTDQEQQIYVVTDPAQLEALQQFAAQQHLGQVNQDTATLTQDTAVLSQDTAVLSQDTAVLSQDANISLSEVHTVDCATLVSPTE